MKIRDYTDYFGTDVKNAVSDIDRVIFVANESQLSAKIKEIAAAEIILVVIIPSTDLLAPDVDNVKNSGTCLMYVLKSYPERDKLDADFIDALEETQDVLQLIQQKMEDDKNTGVHGDCPHIMHYYEPDGAHSDPEYNYLGCNGWSLSFNLLTPGL